MTIETAEALGIEIRTTTPSDVDALVDLVAGDEHACEMFALDSPDRAATLRRSLSRMELPFTILVNGDVAGLRYLSQKPDPRGTHLATGSFLGAPFRGQHVGRVALFEILNACRNKGVKVVSAKVSHQNEAAKRSLAACGFKLVNAEQTRRTSSGRVLPAELWEIEL